MSGRYHFRSGIGNSCQRGIEFPSEAQLRHSSLALRWFCDFVARGFYGFCCRYQWPSKHPFHFANHHKHSDGELIGLRFIAYQNTTLVWDSTGYYLDSLGFNIPTRWQNGSVLVKPRTTTSLQRSICRGAVFMLGNQALSSSGQYSMTFQGVNSCD